MPPIRAKTMKIVSIVGARRQFVKCAPLSRGGSEEPPGGARPSRPALPPGDVGHVLPRTADPGARLPPGVGSGPHGKQTGLILTRVEEVL